MDCIKCARGAWSAHRRIRLSEGGNNYAGTIAYGNARTCTQTDTSPNTGANDISGTNT